MQVLLPDEIPSTLRKLPKQALDPVKERFRSLQQRNLIEPRLPKRKAGRTLGVRKKEKIFARAFVDF